MTTRRCSDCDASFETNDRYARCGSCRYQRIGRIPCPSCGEPMARGAKTCQRCLVGAWSPPHLSGPERAWLAGILEGEGTFAEDCIRVVMTDRDVIEKIVSITQIGRALELPRRQARYKIPYRWQAKRAEHRSFIIGEMGPLLMSRRRASVTVSVGLPDPPPVNVSILSARRNAVAWAAGIVEGEGSLSIRDGRLDVTSVDFEVLERLNQVIGGVVYLPRAPRNPKWKPTRTLCLRRSTGLIEILAELRPWLCARRGAVADQLLGHAESGGLEPPQART